VSEEPNDAPITGDVHDAPLVTQPHGGKLRRTAPDRVTDPTAADAAARAARDVYKLLPSISRIAANRQDPRSKKGGKQAATRKGKYSVNQRVAAFRALLDAARLDRTVRESRLAVFLIKVQDEILEYLPRDQAEALLRKIAVHVAEL